MLKTQINFQFVMYLVEVLVKYDFEVEGLATQSYLYDLPLMINNKYLSGFVCSMYVYQ